MAALSGRIQHDTQVQWLSLVENNAGNGSGENLSNLCALAKNVPFKDPMPPEIKVVVDAVARVAQTNIYDPELIDKAKLAIARFSKV